ncbi:hypothetical protein [Carnobacterium divergens]|uniref:hypothetical protein n=1 Tax=Carnobacterium divergens TaxID=2748 RepID=UPI0039B05FDD
MTEENTKHYNQKKIAELQGYLHDCANNLLIDTGETLIPHNNLNCELGTHEQQFVTDYYNISDVQIAELFFAINQKHNEHCDTSNETYSLADDALALCFALFARLGWIK